MSEILTREEYEDELLGPDGNQGWADVLLAHDAALRAENERLRALARFGALLLPKWWDDGNPGDIDGGDAQEAAEACGLWHEVERHADGVECEWCGNEGPCGELTEAGLAVIAAPEVSR